LLNKAIDQMLDSIITSKTRLKLLIKFFVSAANRGYLRGIADEFNESTNAIRKELNQLTEAGYLLREQSDNKVYYSANTKHSLFAPLQQLIRKHLGLEDILEKIIEKAGDLEEIALVGESAKGVDTNQINVRILGDNLDSAYLLLLAAKAENLVCKKVQLHFSRTEEFREQITLYTK